MKGQTNTPETIAQFMVTKLFLNKNTSKDHFLLDPGCGSGTFIKAVLEWCRNNDQESPRIVGIESDGRLLRKLRYSEFTKQKKNIKLIKGDFLLDDNIGTSTYDFIIANPPYVRLERLSINERKTYRKKFETAVNRFDLYLLFFERALKMLKPNGRLVFLTPERFEYSATANSLRKLMANFHVEEIHHMGENMFKNIKTSPLITVISNTRNLGKPCPTQITYRDGLRQNNVLLPSDGSSWLSVMDANNQKKIMMVSDQNSGYTLGDVCLRISCGVATGLDEVFVIDKNAVPEHLKPYTYPTVGGKDLMRQGIIMSKKILIPYNREGPPLSSTKRLRPLLSWLSKERERLAKRTCVTLKGKVWYSFHENPQLKDILKPKIVCKDIAKEPQFWIDRHGDIVPRHSVYYIIPKNSEMLDELARYLNSSSAKEWLLQNCPRTVKGHIRMQSTFLKKLPIPAVLAISTPTVPSPKIVQNNPARNFT